MVTLWSLDLSTTLAGVLTYSLATGLLLFMYLKFIPWMDDPSFSVLQKLGIYRVPALKRSVRTLSLKWNPTGVLRFPEFGLIPHWKLRLMLEASVIVIVVTDMLSILIYPPLWKAGLVNAIFTFRQVPNGAHTTSYLLVFVIVMLASLKWNDSLKALLYGGLMVFTHEGIWFPFYYISNWGSLNIPLDLAFIAWIGSMAYVARKKYHLKVWKGGLWMFFGYLLSWFSLGFPITVKNISKEAVFYQTQWYGNFYAEANEVVSWMVITGVFVYSLKLNGTGWKVKEILGLHSVSHDAGGQAI